MQFFSGRGGAAAFLCLLFLLFFLPLAADSCFCDSLLRPFNASGRENGKISVDPIGEKEGFSTVLYDNLNGLPTSEANAIAETDEGFIWIGSYGGLIRFDGNTFERMDSTGGIANVVCLYTDSRNRLWIGTNDSGLAVMEQGEIRMWGKADGLPAASVRALAEDGEGILYAGTTEGLTMVDSEGHLLPVKDERVAKAFIQQLRREEDGTVCGLTGSGDIFTISGGKVSGFVGYGDCAVGKVSCLLPDPANPGCVYVDTEESGVFYGSLAEQLKDAEAVDTGDLAYVQQFEYINGSVWICARNGIGVLDGTGIHILKNIPMNRSVSHVMTDYEGNLWFTSSRQGVMKMVPNRFFNLYERWQLPETVVNTTCVADGQLYIGTDTGLLVLGENGPVDHVPLTGSVTASGEELGQTDLLEMFDGCRIRSIIRDSRGRLWFSLWRKYGLVCCDRGRVTVYSEADGLVSDRMRAVCEREDGSMLAFGAGGASVIGSGQVTASYGEEAGIANTEILTAALGDNGDILLGSDGGGIYILDENGQNMRHIGTEDGLGSDIVLRIRKDAVRDIYWIVTGNSLAWMTEEYQVNPIRDFPYANNFDLVENIRGEMWVLSSNGIYVANADELLAGGDTDPVHYSMSNGMPCITTPNAYCELTADGDLYLAGSTGAARVNIDKPFENVSDLKVAVPFVDADGIRLYPDEKKQFSVPAGVQKLTIYSCIYNYSLTNPLVSYHLEGFDREEVTVSRSELTPVTYTNLPGGNYRFVMQLNDPMGHGTKKVSIRIFKAKAFYEKAWFYLLCGLLVLAALAAGVSLYLRRKMRLLDQQHREAKEKERILTELQMAMKIQNSMLPGTFPAFPDRTEFDIYATMEPAKEVGGDYYDFFLIDEDHLGIAIADVSGKGIPAALFMMITKVILQSCAMLGRSVGETLTKTNEAICSNNRMEMFVTIWFGILEISTGRLTASNGGHEYPALKQGSAFTLLKDKHNFVIGGMDGIQYKEYTLELKPGDRLFLYTDGVPEATNGQQELFGTKRMIDALNRNPEGTPQEILAEVRSAVRDFVGEEEPFDDMTMLCLEYRG